MDGMGGSSNEGVQIPYEIFIITGIENLSRVTLDYALYPNPVSDYLTLIIHKESLENMRYQLVDLNGKIVIAKIIESHETSIIMQNYPTAVYFLKVYENNNDEITFKIITAVQNNFLK